MKLQSANYLFGDIIFLKIMRTKKISQDLINRINLSIAVLALLFSLPSTINQARQFITDQFLIKNTRVVYYSPPKNSAKKVKPGECWESIASRREDAARCAGIEDNYIYDPCFFTGEYGEKENVYYYCPYTNITSDRDVLLSVSSKSLQSIRLSGKASKNVTSDKLPWMIIFVNNVVCNLFTGTVDQAFDDKMTLYGCSSGMEVTADEFSNDNYFFNCKNKGKSYFERCLAKTVIF